MAVIRISSAAIGPIGIKRVDARPDGHARLTGSGLMNGRIAIFREAVSWNPILAAFPRFRLITRSMCSPARQPSFKFILTVVPTIGGSCSTGNGNRFPDCQTTTLSAPKHLGTILDSAEKLANGFDFARVDFYEIAGEPRFGEVTFYPGSGLDPFDPPELDLAIGALWLAGLANGTERPVLDGGWEPQAA